MCGCSELKIDNLKNVCLNNGLHHKRNISKEISSEKVPLQDTEETDSGQFPVCLYLSVNKKVKLRT